MSEWNKFKSRRQKIFEKFSANLEHLFQNWQNTEIILPDGGGYVCPIGFTMHSKEGLLDSFNDQLTIEHIPPDSLGGKPICLVRKDINSKSGHTIDKVLLNQKKSELFLKGQAAVKGKLIFNLPQFKYISTDIKVLKEKSTTISFNPGKKNMERLISKVFEKGEWEELIMKLKFTLPKKNHEIRVAFLKYAYLLAFSKVGYALMFGPSKLINPHFDKVRQQIMNMDDNIIPFVPIFKNEGPEIEGLGIVTEPVEIKSLFVRFPLALNGNTDFYTVFLPAPDDTGFTSYKYIESLSTKKENLTFKYDEIKSYNFWESKDKAILFHQIWRGLNNKAK